jgi:large subunit ribosomal protein L25
MTTSGSINLNVSVRQTGKGAARKLRRSALTPAVVYGTGLENKNIALEEKIVVKFANPRFENTIFQIESDDKAINGRKVLMKSVSRDPLSRRPIHVDFFAPDMSQAVRVFVELKFEGKAAGIADGGTLTPILRSLEVECLPDRIPEAIVIDVTNLQVNNSLHISEITLPDGVTAVSKEDLALVACNTMREEEAAPVAAAPAADAAAAGAAAPGAAPAAGAPAKAAAAPAKAAAPKGEKK